MRDINSNKLPLHSVSWVEPNLQMALRYNIYLFLSQWLILQYDLLIILLYWRPLKEQNSCCTQIDRIYIYIYIYVYIVLHLKKNLRKVWNSHSFMVLLSDLAIIELLLLCRLLWRQQAVQKEVELAWCTGDYSLWDHCIIRKGSELVDLNISLLIVSWLGQLNKIRRAE